MRAQKTIRQDLQKLQVFLSATAKPPSNVPVNATRSMATTSNAVNSTSSQMPKSVQNVTSLSSITTTTSIATSNATRSSAPTANMSTISNSSVATSAPSIVPSSNHNFVSGQPTSFPSSTMGKLITPSITVSNQKQSPNSGNGSYNHGNKTIRPTTPSNPPALGLSTASNKNTTKDNLANLHHNGKVSQTASSAMLVPTFTYKTPTPYPSPPTRSHPTFDSVSGWGSDSGFHDLDILWREANTTIHPESLMELAPGNRRKKRGADGKCTALLLVCQWVQIVLHL